MITVTFQGNKYQFDLKAALEALTGHETVMVEDYLGGWDKFRTPSAVAKSTVVMVWLAKRSARERVTFDQIAETPGLLFGDAWQIKDDEENDLDGQSPPAGTQTTTTAQPPSEPDGSRKPVLTSLSERAS